MKARLPFLLQGGSRMELQVSRSEPVGASMTRQCRSRVTAGDAILTFASSVPRFAAHKHFPGHDHGLVPVSSPSEKALCEAHAANANKETRFATRREGIEQRRWYQASEQPRRPINAVRKPDMFGYKSPAGQLHTRLFSAMKRSVRLSRMDIMELRIIANQTSNQGGVLR
jgi:hypothetical protein